MTESNTPLQSSFDAIILGGGINGCGIARELGVRGKHALILEKETIGSGTSSKSSRLIHGGLRYLETFQFQLVRESLRDREELLHLYPNLVQRKPFYLPCYSPATRSPWMIWLGVEDL